MREIPKARTRALLQYICDWERLSYGEGLHRTVDQLETWLAVENRGFHCIFSEHSDTLVAYTDIWSVQDDFFRKLKAGLETEEDIPAEVFCSFDAPSSHWYVGSIITNPEIRAVNPRLAHAAFREVGRLFARFFSIRERLPLEVMGVASSSTGARILDLWRFSPVDKDVNAIDHRPRYVKQIRTPFDASIFSPKLLNT